MYRLFNRINNLKPMSESMREYLTTEGMGIVKKHQQKEELDCDAYINELLDMHEKYSDLVNNYFKKNSLFLEAMKDVSSFFSPLQIISILNDLAAAAAGKF